MFSFFRNSLVFGTRYHLQFNSTILSMLEIWRKKKKWNSALNRVCFVKIKTTTPCKSNSLSNYSSKELNINHYAKHPVRFENEKPLHNSSEYLNKHILSTMCISECILCDATYQRLIMRITRATHDYGCQLWNILL